MFSVFVPSDFSLKKAVAVDLAALPESAVWIDLVKPTPEEDHAVERLAGIAVPTREDMQEIEISSRLYIENAARYMTATLMCQSDTDMPRTTAVTFILARDHRRDGADGIDGCGDRSLCRHSGTLRRRHRPGVARHF